MRDGKGVVHMGEEGRRNWEEQRERTIVRIDYVRKKSIFNKREKIRVIKRNESKFS